MIREIIIEIEDADHASGLLEALKAVKKGFDNGGETSLLYRRGNAIYMAGFIGFDVKIKNVYQKPTPGLPNISSGTPMPPCKPPKKCRHMTTVNGVCTWCNKKVKRVYRRHNVS